MTVKISLECDAYGCCNELEIFDCTEIETGHMGWHSCPMEEGNHYCPSCWPKVKKELNQEEP